MWNSLGRIVAALLLCLPGLAPGAHAQDWHAQERACMSRCPPFPRFNGIETDAQYKARMDQQAAHDRCFLKCAHRTSSSFAPSFVPIDEAAKAYYRRNGVPMGK